MGVAPGARCQVPENNEAAATMSQRLFLDLSLSCARDDTKAAFKDLERFAPAPLFFRDVSDQTTRSLSPPLCRAGLPVHPAGVEECRSQGIRKLLTAT